MTHEAKGSKKRSWIQHWNAIPLYGRILVAMAAGVICGLAAGKHAAVMEVPAQVILQLLGAIAPPLILVAVTHVLMTSEIPRGTAFRLGGLLILNTLVAILIGLAVANVVRPGRFAKLDKPKVEEKADAADTKNLNPVEIIRSNIPRSILGPLGDNQNVIGVILIAIAFGIALRGLRDVEVHTVRDVVDVAYKALIVVLHWIIHLVPIGVFAIVARVVGVQGFGPFKALLMFVVAVLLALSLQLTWYLVRIKFFSWPRPIDVLRGMRDALFMAFSTSSSTATMPVTYTCLREKVGLREDSASLGALVGANFNNDGTALYEAMAALFIAQAIGQDLSTFQQLMVVLTSVLASVGAAGIPEAGLVTMTLVFNAVGLPTDYIALLIAVDWFLDRCRTTINVFGDVNVSCMLEGRRRATAA